MQSPIPPLEDADTSHWTNLTHPGADTWSKWTMTLQPMEGRPATESQTKQEEVKHVDEQAVN